MKKKIMVIGGVLLATVLFAAPVASNAMQYDGRTEGNQEVEEQSDVQEGQLEELEKLKEDIQDLTSSANYDENKYKELSEDIMEQEMECEMFDYREEVELRLNTVKTAIQDMERDLETGVSEEIAQDINDRINILIPIVNKYNLILEKGDSETIDYEKIAIQLDDELSKVYKKIN